MQIIHFRKIPDFNRGLKERWRRRQRERPKNIKFTPRSHCGIRYILLRFDLRSARTVDLHSTDGHLSTTATFFCLQGGGGGGGGALLKERLNCIW